jgi:hypothetical protein
MKKTLKNNHENEILIMFFSNEIMDFIIDLYYEYAIYTVRSQLPKLILPLIASYRKSLLSLVKINMRILKRTVNILHSFTLVYL